MNVNIAVSIFATGRRCGVGSTPCGTNVPDDAALEFNDFRLLTHISCCVARLQDSCKCCFDHSVVRQLLFSLLALGPDFSEKMVHNCFYFVVARRLIGEFGLPVPLSTGPSGRGSG
jgi:hypothetical protein